MRACILLTAMLLLTAEAAAQSAPLALRQWGGWRGPLSTGVAPLANPPLQWSETQNVRWKVELPGEGASTPIIWEDRLFVTAAVATQRKAQEPPQADARSRTQPPDHVYQFLILCLDRATGAELWRSVACEAVPHEGRHPTNTYASGSPVTDGKRLYASFGSNGVYCYDLSGKLLWSRDLGRMRTRLGWGEASTPALHGDRLILNWDHEDDSFLVALDAASGAVIWKTLRPQEPTSWATPLITEHQGVTYVVVNGSGKARGYNLADGQVLWECGGQTINAIPSPVRIDDFVVCMSGYRGQLAAAIPLSARGDVSDGPSLLWKYTRDTPYVPSPLAYGEGLFFTKSLQPILTCLDARTGQVRMEPQRIPEITEMYASPMGAAERVYLAGRNGTTVVIANRTPLEVLAVNILDDRFDASPAAVDSSLYLRGARHLYCLQEVAP